MARPEQAQPGEPMVTLHGELPILSWNIHDAVMHKEGFKAEDQEFVQILKQSAIFCLQETKSKFHLANYECFNSNRADSRSGGVCIGVHRSLSKNVKLIANETGCPDFQALTIYPHDEKRNFTIINVYDSPEQSSYKIKRKSPKSAKPQQETTLEYLLEFRSQHPEIGEILLVGDLNARIGHQNYDPDDEENDEDPYRVPKSHPGQVSRTSKDGVSNTRGSLLLDFLACCKLSILNGCTLGDILGEFTSVNYNGASVVDYMAATPNLLESIESFKVLDLSRFSDHKPCICKLRCPSHRVDPDELLETLEDVPGRYKWNDEDEKLRFQFLAAQNSVELKTKIEALTNTQCSNIDDVIDFNKDLVGVLHEIADSVIPRKGSGRSTTKSQSKSSKRTTRKHRMKPKKPWFDSVCINSKRDLNRLAKRYGKKPTDANLRVSYYEKRRDYRRLIKSKKAAFMNELYSDIESGKNINWSRFKKLKDMKTVGTKLDVFDMLNFCKFFQKLYNKPSIEEKKLASMQHEMTKQSKQSGLSEILDRDISEQELEDCIASCKKKKAVSEDLIPNEFLHFCGVEMRRALLNLFNQCLSHGVYPWTTSVVTPLHKKGSIYDPNNYRAIAVASNLGKLFATILLKRLIIFRAKVEPDTPNQLGFCQGAQTADHILTLSTCIEKYVQVKKVRLFSCFVDYAKAFDTVCREALLYKLWKMGIQGRFFGCLEYMYTHSSAKIKLLNKLSEKIDVLCGTEQGHPMSPELFKCFVHQLSEDLNSLKDVAVPILNENEITHLLWADDLILLALDKESLQKMLNILLMYCAEWGLSVNISKTAIMVFNRAGRILKESMDFQYGNTPISSAREYTYLGITVSLTGSMKMAQTKLKQKGIRSYFSLKSMLDLNHLRKTAVFKLFDSLIVPVIAYGCQIWLPMTNFMKTLSEGSFPTGQKFAEDPIEKVHLSFMKWTLGVNKFTSNCAVWGDTGRYPLGIELSTQVYGYMDRLEKLCISDSGSLVRHAFEEQRILKLTCFNRLQAAKRVVIQRKDALNHHTLNPKQIRTELKESFVEQWNKERSRNGKMGFYNSIKTEFGQENYLHLDLSYHQLKRFAQFRTSSHRFKIETGRHGILRNSVLNRICNYCSTDDLETLRALESLPEFDPVIEDEDHVIRTCSYYEDLRASLNESMKGYLEEDLKTLFTKEEHIRGTAKLLVRINGRRFPKKNIEID